MKTSLLLLVCLCFAFSDAFQFFEAQIPNGDLVPHPCKPNYLWKGVGHFNVQGGGDRNPFGEDFERFGKEWNKQLCTEDSDGDGRSNGEELGDPECVWTPEGGAPSTSASGHPGVCEPIDSPTCKEKNAAVKENWDFCKQGDLKCDNFKEPGVENFTIALNAGTIVPPKDTTYMCQLVKLPDAHEYHIVGTKPTIDNQIVAHHIIVYGCEESALELLSAYSSPKVCDAMLIFEACKHSVGGWTVGSDGYCEIPNVGTRFGKGVFNYAVIEIHWNNPKESPNYVDGSGLTIFYTPNLRKYDASAVVIGQQSLAIPPNVQAHYDTSVCTSDCTRRMEEPIYIYRVLLHMHYLGRGGKVEHWRNGTLLRVLVENSAYSYDNPIYQEVDPPAKFKAGDELKMFCKFNSKSRNEVTYFGDGTSDEMCFSVLNFYPRTKFTSCTSFGAVDMCFDQGSDPMVEIYESVKKVGCETSNFLEMMTAFAKEAVEFCGEDENASCTPECREFLEIAYAERKCLKYGLRFLFEALLTFGKDPEAEEVVRLLHLCDKHILEAKPDINYLDRQNILAEHTESVEGSASAVSSGFVLTAVMMILAHF